MQDTDHTSFVAVYSCQDLLVARQEIGWILTREQFPSKHTVITEQRKGLCAWSREFYFGFKYFWTQSHQIMSDKT